MTILTADQIVSQAAMLLFDIVPTSISPVAICAHIEMILPLADLNLPIDALSERYLIPAMGSLAATLPEDAAVVNDWIELPDGLTMGAIDRRGLRLVGSRGDFYPFSFFQHPEGKHLMMRFDIRCSA